MEWLNGFKNLYASYKRFTSDVRIHTDREQMDQKRYFIRMKTKES